MMKQLIVFFLIHFFNQTISIIEPEELRLEIQEDTIKYIALDVGNVHYGRSVIGKLIQSNPFDACTPLKNEITDEERTQGLIFVAERGGDCTFSQKILNAQKLGASLVIFFNNINEDIESLFPVERSKTVLDLIEIPAILISKDQSKILKKYLIKNKSQIHISVFFDVNHIQQKHHLTAIVQTDDFKSVDFLQKLNEIDQTYQDFLRMQIFFRVFLEKDIKNLMPVTKEENCVTLKNKYCVLNSNENPQNKVNLAKLTVAQICLLQSDWYQFFLFNNMLKEKCFANEKLSEDFEGCFTEQFSNLSNEVQQKVVECKDDPIQLEQLLKTNSENQQLKFINYSPFVFINEKVYKGNFSNFDNIFESVCYTYERMPNQCKRIKGYKISIMVKNNKLVWFVIFSILFFGSVIFFFLLSFYILMKKRMDATYKQNLNQKIQEALSKYYEDEEMKEELENEK